MHVNEFQQQTDGNCAFLHFEVDASVEHFLLLYSDTAYMAPLGLTRVLSKASKDSFVI